MSRRIWIERLIAVLLLVIISIPAWRVHESRKACVNPGYGFTPQRGDC